MDFRISRNKNGVVHELMNDDEDYLPTINKDILQIHSLLFGFLGYIKIYKEKGNDRYGYVKATRIYIHTYLYNVRVATMEHLVSCRVCPVVHNTY